MLESSNESSRRAGRYHMYWTDRSVTRTRVAALREHQMINHWPGMLALTSKAQLAANIRAMQEQHNDEYDFVPSSWLLPEEFAAFQRECAASRHGARCSTYIVKPERGCQGRKIFLTDDADDEAIRKAAWLGAMGGNTLVAQRYIERPFIFYAQPSDKGYKFDLRLYVVVTACDPVRVVLYHDGLARFCTEPYSAHTVAGCARDRSSATWQYRHLTNSSLNTHNAAYHESTDADNPLEGSKRRVAVLFDWLEKEGHDVGQLWESLEDMVAKSVLAVQPILQHVYRLCRPRDAFADRCFELLGMDVLLDADLKPWLLEFNHSPSLHVSGCVDEAVKLPLVVAPRPFLPQCL